VRYAVVITETVADHPPAMLACFVGDRPMTRALAWMANFAPRLRGQLEAEEVEIVEAVAPEAKP
jgi:hypothetical protein